MDQGIALDEIPTYAAWEDAWVDAANDRELVTLAGISAFLLGLGAILDSATAGNNGAPATANAISPTINVEPLTGDFALGARVRL